MPKTQPKRKAQGKKPARKSVVAKANKRKTEKALGANRKNFLEVVHEDMLKVAAGVEEKMTVLGTELFANQKALEQSHLRLDDQFAVLTRILISSLNRIVDVVNDSVKTIAHIQTEAGMEVTSKTLLLPVTYEDVNKVFVLFDEFKKRPDFRDHFRAWYTGEDVSKLPPPVVEAKVEDKKTSALGESADFPEGAQIFGGNYAESADGDVNASADGEDAEADEVSEVPEPHSDGAEPDESEGDGAVL